MEGTWNQIDRRKGLTMQDFQKTLLITAGTAIVTLAVNGMFTLPRIEERTALNYESIAKSIDSYTANMQALNMSVGKLQTDVEVMKNNLEFVKEIANTKVKTIEGRMGVLEYRVGTRKTKEED